MNVLEHIDLERFLSDDVGCQSTHRVVKECSIYVTHLFKWCSGSRMICDSSAEHVIWLLENSDGKCNKCQRIGKLCWSVIPI